MLTRLIHTLIAETRYTVWRWLLLNGEDSPEARLHRSLGTSGLLASGVLAQRMSDNFVVVKLLLERYPLWVRGHKFVGDTLLEAGDVSGAMTSVDAVVSLEGAESEWSRTRRGEGYLRRGDVENSRKIFELLISDGYRTPRNLEGLGAALIAQGEWRMAVEALERIPTPQRTSPGQVALTFARRKLSEGIGSQ